MFEAYDRMKAAVAAFFATPRAEVEHALVKAEQAYHDAVGEVLAGMRGEMDGLEEKVDQLEKVAKNDFEEAFKPLGDLINTLGAKVAALENQKPSAAPPQPQPDGKPVDQVPAASLTGNGAADEGNA